ncbi:hypothetical protein R6Q59_032470 [Mikania micrantha]
MSRRGKRGVSSCSKKCGEKDYIIEFNENNQPIGRNCQWFMSNFALKCKELLPYHVDSKDIPQETWDEPWLQIKAKSNKARASAMANNNFAHVGRTGFAGLGEKFDVIWPQLEKKYEYIKKIQAEKTRLWILSKAKKNKENKCYELDEDVKEKIHKLVQQRFVEDFLKDEDFDSIAPQVPSEYELGPMGFMNLMEQIEPQNLYTPELPSINAPDPEPKFIDPEINISLEKIKKRPLSIRSIVEVLSTYVGDEYAITYSSPNGMYDKTYVQGVSYGELLHLFCNEWLDISVVHLFTMYFYELSNSKCAFLNPHDIAGDVCIKNPNRAKDHILEIGHWLVFIIYPLKRQGYIIDSINNHKGKENYAFSFIVEDALGVKLNWELVKCKQQRSTWECGFCVIKHMHEFVTIYQHNFPENIWNEMKFFTQKDIDQMILQLVPQVVDNLFPNKT